MGKSYRINRNKLQEISEYLMNLNDLQYCSDIIVIDELLNLLNNTTSKDKKMPIIETLRAELSEYTLGNTIRPFIEDFATQGIYIPEFSKPRFTQYHFTDEEAIRTTRDFYSQVGTFFSNELDNFLKKAHTNLEFIKPRPNWDGSSYMLSGLNDVYTVVPNYNNITKISILIHELEHVIEFLKNSSFSNQIIIREVGALFMEMIGLDFVSEQHDLNEDNYIRKFYLHCIIKGDSYAFLYKDNFFKILEKYKHLSSKEILKVLNDKYDIPRETVRHLALNGIESLYFYQIAYLIAIELYYIYKEDKKAALNILKDIILNANEQNFLNILQNSGIVLNTNVIQYENEISAKLGLI